MPVQIKVKYGLQDFEILPDFKGRIAVAVDPKSTSGHLCRRLNKLTKGAVGRFLDSDKFDNMKEGAGHELSFPAGLAADSLLLIKLPRNSDSAMVRRAGALAARGKTGEDILLALGGLARPIDFVEGMLLRSYSFTARKSSGKGAEKPGTAKATVLVTNPSAHEAPSKERLAIVDGVFFARDLVNEPANVLTTEEFASRLEGMRDLGLEVKTLGEKEMAKLGMNALLGVGQGSSSPSKAVVMKWKGGKGDPFALVGKGVVFDTGGISLKPAPGMEAMTMDMGGAAVVAGVMRALALRKSKANVVGVVGLVENMPDGNAQRPGDVVVSMKGDSIEILNTDAEGRLVLADLLWYVQERHKPSGIIDLATLTGAVIVALGNENAGVFSNHDRLCGAFLRASAQEGEGGWRLPLGEGYDKLLESDFADMKNVAGRPAGSITAAQFLQRFVKEGIPWIHLDIAGVASIDGGTDLSPSGATGWGVRSIDRLIRDTLEGGSRLPPSWLG